MEIHADAAPRDCRQSGSNMNEMTMGGDAAAAPRPAGEERRVRGPARRLEVWLPALAVTLLAAAAGAGWSDNVAERTRAELLEQTRQDLEVHALGVRGAAARLDHLPAAVAQHPALAALLAAPRDAARVAAANALLAETNRRSGAEALYVMDTSGLTLASSNWNAPAQENFVGRNYGQRPYFRDALAGRTGRFHGVGLTTGRPGLFIASPVSDGSRIVGVVAVKIGFEALDSTWEGASTPLLVSDARGVVFLGTVPEWNCTALAPLAASDVAAIRASGQYPNCKEFKAPPWRGGSAAAGGPAVVEAAPAGRQVRFAVVERPLARSSAEEAGALGWKLTMLASLEPVERSRNQALVSAALLSLLLGAATLLWQGRGRRLADERAQKVDLEQRVVERTVELQEQLSLRRAMEGSLLVGMRARDLEGRILYVNPAFCRMVGYDESELVGRLPPYPYWHPDHIEKHWSDSDAALAGQAAPTGFESVIRHRDGRSVVTMVYTAPLVDAAGRHTGWMSSVVDVTAQREAEQRLRLVEERLRNASRLVTMGEIASTITHEISQPLTALSVWAMAARGCAERGDRAALDEALVRIGDEAERSSRVVRQMRQFIGAREISAEALDLGELVAGIAPVWQARAQAVQTRVTVQLPGELPLVRADRTLIEQVLLNLVTNAVQAVRGQATERRLVEVSAAVAEGAVRIEVADHGHGVAPEAQAHLFDPFFTTRDGGLGLGLHTCRRIVEAHRGRIAFRARPEGGAVFSFTLPT